MSKIGTYHLSDILGHRTTFYFTLRCRAGFFYFRYFTGFTPEIVGFSKTALTFFMKLTGKNHIEKSGSAAQRKIKSCSMSHRLWPKISERSYVLISLILKLHLVLSKKNGPYSFHIVIQLRSVPSTKCFRTFYLKYWYS